MLFPSWSVGDRLRWTWLCAGLRHPSTSWPLCLRCQIIRANSQLKEGRGHAPIIHFLYTRKEDPAVIIDNTPLNDAPNVCFLGNTLSYKVFSLSVVQTCNVAYQVTMFGFQVHAPRWFSGYWLVRRLYWCFRVLILCFLSVGRGGGH